MEDKTIKTPVLLFDHECSLCVRFKQSMERLTMEKTIYYTSAHNPNVYEQFTNLEKEQCLKTIHLVLDEKGEEVLTGEKAIEFLITLNPNIKKFTWLIESKMGQKALDFFYHAANKYRESLLNRCCGCRK